MEQINGYCVEWIVSASDDGHGSLDIDTVEYFQRFFRVRGEAFIYAKRIARQRRCPCVMGEIAIHDATYGKHHTLTAHWRVNDDRNTTWVSLGDGETYQ